MRAPRMGAGLSRTPWDLSYTARLEEATVVMFDVAEKAMAAAAVAPKEARRFLFPSAHAYMRDLSCPSCCRVSAVEQAGRLRVAMRTVLASRRCP